MRKQEFPGIEILSVISIIIIAIALYVALFKPQEKLIQRRDLQRKKDLGELQQALEVYYHDFRKYPEAIDNKIDGIAWGGSFHPYVTRLPVDPLSPLHRYIYWVNPMRDTYRIYASLEAKNSDPQVCKPNLLDGGPCDFVPQELGAQACGGVCNYAVASPNTSY